jgi:hypothetical protein
MKDDKATALRGMVNALPGQLGITGLQEFQRSLGVSEYLSPTARFASAQSQYAELLARAQGGDLDAVRGFSSNAAQLLGVGRENFASGPEFAALMRQVNLDLADVLGRQQGLQTEILADVPVVIQQAAQDQIAALKAGFKANTDALEGIKEQLRLLTQAQTP